jgi:2-polyprenyl-3-methyl-5-hydroxy-6-metoxy-1,4-benzoquinol methylase
MISKTKNCPVCSSSNYKTILNTKETADFYKIDKNIIFSIVKCQQCSMIYVNPTLDNITMDQLYSSGDLPSEIGFEASRQIEYKRIIERIKKIKPKGYILEVGSGHGHILNIAKNDGYQVMGLEINKKACDYSKNIGLDVINSPIETADLKDEHFDIAILFHLLEHVADPYSIIIHAFKTLKKDGILVISAPNVDCIGRMLKGKQWIGWHPVEHIQYFSFKTLRILLKKAGFKIIKKPYVAKFSKYKKTLSENIIETLVFLKDFTENTFNIYPSDLLVYAKK